MAPLPTGVPVRKVIPEVSTQGGWGSWDGPGRGVFRICCKGAPRRAEARNINDSPPALRVGRGLCNRFGRTTPRAPGKAVAGRATTTAGAPFDRGDHTEAPPRAPHGNVPVRENVPLADVLAGRPAISWAGLRHDMRDAVPFIPTSGGGRNSGVALIGSSGDRGDGGDDDGSESTHSLHGVLPVTLVWLFDE